MTDTGKAALFVKHHHRLVRYNLLNQNTTFISAPKNQIFNLRIVIAAYKIRQYPVFRMSERPKGRGRGCPHTASKGQWSALSFWQWECYTTRTHRWGHDVAHQAFLILLLPGTEQHIFPVFVSSSSSFSTANLTIALKTEPSFSTGWYYPMGTGHCYPQGCSI